MGKETHAFFQTIMCLGFSHPQRSANDAGLSSLFLFNYCFVVVHVFLRAEGAAAIFYSHPTAGSSGGPILRRPSFLVIFTSFLLFLPERNSSIHYVADPGTRVQYRMFSIFPRMRIHGYYSATIML